MAKSEKNQKTATSQETSEINTEVASVETTEQSAETLPTQDSETDAAQEVATSAADIGSLELPVTQSELVTEPAGESTVPTPADVVGDAAAAQTASYDAPAVEAKRSIVLVRLEHTLDNYITSMASNVPHSPQEGSDIQRQFYRGAIEGVVYTANAEDFIAGMNLLLDTIEANITGVFSDRYAFRYWDNLSLPRKQVLEFEHLLRLFTHIAPKDTRKDQLAKAKSKLDFTLGHIQNEHYRERLNEYLRRMAA